MQFSSIVAVAKSGSAQVCAPFGHSLIDFVFTVSKITDTHTVSFVVELPGLLQYHLHAED